MQHHTLDVVSRDRQRDSHRDGDRKNMLHSVETGLPTELSCSRRMASLKEEENATK